VSWFWAAATRALTASFGELKVCSSDAETQTGSAKPSPNISNIFLKIIGINAGYHHCHHRHHGHRRRHHRQRLVPGPVAKPALAAGRCGMGDCLHALLATGAICSRVVRTLDAGERAA